MSVCVRPRRGGPLVVEGEVELYDLLGQRVDTARMRKLLLCRCGATGRPPLCDGAHNRGTFAAAEPADDADGG